MFQYMSAGYNDSSSSTYSMGHCFVCENSCSKSSCRGHCGHKCTSNCDHRCDGSCRRTTRG